MDEEKVVEQTTVTVEELQQALAVAHQNEAAYQETIIRMAMKLVGLI